MSAPRAAIAPSDPGDDTAGAVFAALADPTRRAILRAVAGHGETTATSLAARLPVSRQAVTKHLRALADAGLVRSERHGREHRFVATPGPLDEAVAWMAAVGGAWEERLDRLQRLVDAPGRDGATGVSADPTASRPAPGVNRR